MTFVISQYTHGMASSDFIIYIFWVFMFLVFLKVDWDKWVDEDEEQDNKRQ